MINELVRAKCLDVKKAFIVNALYYHGSKFHTKNVGKVQWIKCRERNIYIKISDIIFIRKLSF